MKAAIALAILVFSASCATARGTQALSVADVVARHNELDGRVVRIRGWVGECHGRSCGLYETRSGAHGNGAEAGSLSIGTAPAFDRQVRSLGRAQIVVDARVRAVCFNDPMPAGVVEVCADRVDQLQPIRIVQVLSRGGTN